MVLGHIRHRDDEEGAGAIDAPGVVTLERAAATMGRNKEAFREAPPTRAPLMSGSARRVAALSGVTLPP
jgi:hypothetical protein